MIHIILYINIIIYYIYICISPQETHWFHQRQGDFPCAPVGNGRGDNGDDGDDGVDGDNASVTDCSDSESQEEVVLEEPKTGRVSWVSGDIYIYVFKLYLYIEW